MKNKSLIERAYEYVCSQPGHTADQYLTAMKVSIRSGGCFTMLERCGYIRFADNVTPKRWYPVLVNGQTQRLDLNHPFILQEREAKKQASLPEMKYGIKLGEFLAKLAKSDFLTEEKKAELYNYVIEYGYAHALCWKQQGYKNIVQGAEYTLKAIEKANAELEKLANENFSGEE